MPVDTVGELTVLQACDFEHGHTEVIHMLKDFNTGKTTRLRFNRRAPARLRSGTVLRVQGEEVNEEIVLAANGSGSVETVVEAPLVSGNQNTVVILINFLDANIECSPASVANLMFSGSSSVNGLYREMSYGNASFSGDVFGPFTINYTSTGTCNYNGWASAAETAAQAAGANLSSYTRKVYVFPKTNPCGWAGLGTIGGNPSRAWIAYCDLGDVYAHELGHNLTMHHASTDANDDNVSDCEYCDTSDVMGYGGVGLRQVDGPHKEVLGWTPANKVVSLSGNATYQVAPLEYGPTDTPYPQLLKVARASGGYYYFSYRRQIGYDVGMPSQYADRLTVHRYAGSGSSQTFLIQTLGDGQTFTDPFTGLTVTVLSHTPDYAFVQVSGSCAPVAATATLSSTNSNGAAGSTFSYGVSVRNNDSAPCGSSTFNLGAAVPVGWTASILPSSLVLGLGQTSAATLTVTSPVSATNGNYSVGVNVTDSGAPAHDTFAVGSAVIYSISSPPPPPPITVTATSNRGRARLRWNRPKGMVVSSYRVYRDDGTGSFSVIATKRGRSLRDEPDILDATYAYYVAACNATGSEIALSETTSVLVAATRSRIR